MIGAGIDAALSHLKAQRSLRFEFDRRRHSVTFVQGHSGELLLSKIISKLVHDRD